MKQEYKDFLQDVFHNKSHSHKISDPDYYSYKYKISKETDNTIDLLLDDDFLEDKMIHSLVLNLDEWGLMITQLVIASEGWHSDETSLLMQITEMPRDEKN